MEKHEGVYRALAARIWEETYPAEHVHDFFGRTSFVNLVSAGIASGVRAYNLGMDAKQTGCTDMLYFIFEDPRIV